MEECVEIGEFDVDEVNVWCNFDVKAGLEESVVRKGSTNGRGCMELRRYSSRRGN